MKRRKKKKSRKKERGRGGYGEERRTLIMLKLVEYRSDLGGGKKTGFKWIICHYDLGQFT